jgi:small subunit ribosomal protein S6
MKKYEVLYIVPASLTEAEVQKIADHFKGVVEKNGGTVDSAGLWEKRKLAYEIEGHRDGNYAQAPAELNRLMRISDDVVRHRIYALEEATA